MNVIFIQYLFNYLGDSLRDRAFATRFFLSYQAFVFQFEYKQLRRQRSDPEKIGTQSLSQMHFTFHLLITNLLYLLFSDFSLNY